MTRRPIARSAVTMSIVAATATRVSNQVQRREARRDERRLVRVR